ncbi:hypothetical protein HaLaN_25939, partial [Haematococcus lacustris]
MSRVNLPNDGPPTPPAPTKAAKVTNAVENGALSKDCLHEDYQPHVGTCPPVHGIHASRGTVEIPRRLRYLEKYNRRRILT